jgi:hypothetical protein
MTVADLNEQSEREILQRDAGARAPWQRPKVVVLNAIEAEFAGSPGFDGCLFFS